MKSWTILFCIVLFNLAMAIPDCPEGEYYPGPDCTLEPSCQGNASATAHAKHACETCWCKPGTLRNLETNTCVESC
ncbi:hypothetical protein B5X24_HaOG216322 [Helicoverpa armigera]|nr:hypothetical protein B5X24_HaOG216322 [Helicoverpa armigera]